MKRNHAGGAWLSRKYSVSNIIWTKGKNEFFKFIESAKECGLDGVELALNCIWEEPVDVSDKDLNIIKSLIQDYGLNISALHALTYTRPELSFFRDESSYRTAVDYLLKYIDIASELGVNNIVLGSPTLRKKYQRDYKDCCKIFNEFLCEYDSCDSEVILNVEPLSTDMCDFINTIEEANLFVKSFKNINVQLDTRVLIEQNLRTVTDNINFTHCQVGNPGMSFHEESFDESHYSFSKKLKDINYSGYIAAEILCPEKFDKLEYLKIVSGNLKKLYG